MFYYINTNEIPGELSRENLISSHVKIISNCWTRLSKYRDLSCSGEQINYLPQPSAETLTNHDILR